MSLHYFWAKMKKLLGVRFDRRDTTVAQYLPHSLIVLFSRVRPGPALESNVYCTGFAFRIEHRKWNRGHNRLPKLVQTIAPSIPFPVFNPEGEPGICCIMSSIAYQVQLYCAMLCKCLWPSPRNTTFVEGEKNRCQTGSIGE